MISKIADSAIDPIIGVDLVGRTIYCNQAFSDQLGYQKQEVVGKRFSDFLCKENVADLEKIRELILFSMTPEPFIVECLTHDRIQMSYNIQASAIYDDTGKTIGLSYVLRTVRQLDRATANASALLETAPDAMVIVNEHHQIVLVNVQTEKLFGYTKEQLLGQEIEVLIPNVFLVQNQQHLHQQNQKSTTTCKDKEGDLLGTHKNGKTFPVEVSYSPLKTKNETFISAAIRDISARKKVEEELENFNEKLHAKNKELEQFAYIASHDLLEPLRTINSFIDLFNRQYGGKLDNTADKYLSFMSEASTRMNDVIRGLLEYSRIGHEKELKLLDCNEIVNFVLEDLSVKISENNVIIHVEELPDILGHQLEIRLLFQNLISNAIKFKRNDVQTKVKIEAQKESDFWCFSIRDNGIGIEPEYLERIFLMFQRLHNKSEYQGSGIGLTHCQKIVKLHGGEIWVESEFNEGSTFYFTLKA